MATNISKRVANGDTGMDQAGRVDNQGMEDPVARPKACCKGAARFPGISELFPVNRCQKAKEGILLARG
jgi:hypothetical protein